MMMPGDVWSPWQQVMIKATALMFCTPSSGTCVPLSIAARVTRLINFSTPARPMRSGTLPACGCLWVDRRVVPDGPACQS